MKHKLPIDPTATHPLRKRHKPPQRLIVALRTPSATTHMLKIIYVHFRHKLIIFMLFRMLEQFVIVQQLIDIYICAAVIKRSLGLWRCLGDLSDDN